MPSEDEQRAAVVAEARSFTGTAYHNCARVKCTRDAMGRIIDRGGVDCAQFPYLVYHATGHVPELALEHYPPDWHLHRKAERYLRIVMEHGHETSDPKPADFVLWRIPPRKKDADPAPFCHGAIILDPGWPNIIHASWKAKLVYPARGDQGDLAGMIPRFFTLW